MKEYFWSLNQVDKIQRLIKKYKIKPKDILVREDGRIEWLCKHGVGHTIWYPKGSDDIHGCDGCCHKFTKKP